MKTIIEQKIFGILVVSLLVIGCQGYDDHHGVMGVIDTANASPNVPVAAEISPTVNTVKVTKPYQGGIFYAESRKDKIGRYPCSGCHNGNTVTISNARETAHGEIVLNHGAVTKPDACHTCHDPDSRDFLIIEEGIKVDFDHSYQKCAQCHFRQEKDWVGGAHGKRLSFWEGKRVVANCTSCHNPHSPRFEKRWPSTYSPSDVVLNVPESESE
ncbi:MAG: hypothetical protein MJE63_34405 [Proteobacteria bacterium]|nr:hypothetical protein [Pseudomonadota bacterium]